MGSPRVELPCVVCGCHPGRNWGKPAFLIPSLGVGMVSIAAGYFSSVWSLSQLWHKPKSSRGNLNDSVGGVCYFFPTAACARNPTTRHVEEEGIRPFFNINGLFKLNKKE